MYTIYPNVKNIIFQLFVSILKTIFFNHFKFYFDITIFYFPPLGGYTESNAELF